MNYGMIKNCDIANGIGCRVSLFVSGCRHHCKGCFNAMTWDFNYGQVFTEDTEEQILKLLEPEYIDGLTVLGGEPFEVPNQRRLLRFLQRVKSLYPDKTIWCYTGYRLEKDLLSKEVPGSGRLNARCECTDGMLSLIDVLVDGRFVQDKRDISLAFCGSSNQRVIDLKQTLAPYFSLPFEDRHPEELQIQLYL